MQYRKVYTATLFLLLLHAVFPLSAYAIQVHTAPEGLYVHQIGHILFTVAMVGFAVRIRYSRLYSRPGWHLMFSGAILFALWNGWAFVGHIVTLQVQQTDFIKGADGLKSFLLLSSPMNIVYYVLRLDHLLCVPALLCIYFSLRKMTAQPPADPTANGEGE